MIESRIGTAIWNAFSWTGPAGLGAAVGCGDIVSFIEGGVDFLDRGAKVLPQVKLLLGDHIKNAISFPEFDGPSLYGRLLLLDG